MAPNLFSIFDPSSSLHFSLNWMSLVFMVLFIPQSLWLIPSRQNSPLSILTMKLFNEFKIILNNTLVKSVSMFTAIFTFILMNNFISLFPYIFTSTAHLSISLAMSLPMWLSFMFFGWLNNTNNMFNHLVPQGTPSILMPFMVVIESISNLIRPLTLAVRLSANMIAGHLLLTLLSSTATKVYFIILYYSLLLNYLLLFYKYEWQYSKLTYSLFLDHFIALK
uniref:ATP synthase subunit a n=2 Tax=unclassified Megaspilidae TaxID=1253067 RepID=A0A3S5HLP8_9HYME|nr:ATP synthase FO subunit 6 [Megaspilidae sp. SJW-2015]AZL93337.1 ATP synthase F0 subunit 6 [Megaspilidae sp. ZJUH_2016022]